MQTIGVLASPTDRSFLKLQEGTPGHRDVTIIMGSMADCHPERRLLYIRLVTSLSSMPPPQRSCCHRRLHRRPGREAALAERAPLLLRWTFGDKLAICWPNYVARLLSPDR